jgi:nucleoside-diphosphate-sugar epimerase
MDRQTHVILGTGPVGCWIARALREQNIPVRVVNRSGKRPDLMPDDVELVTANVSDPGQAAAAAADAAVVYQALNPPYHQWHRYFPGLQAGAMAAAKAAGARYVSIENLYMYDSTKTITEESPILPKSKKGELRARMADEVMAAHQQGELQAAALRASDYYGPGVLGSALGEMVFGNLVAGKKAQVGGSAAMPHSFAYIEDVGRAAAVLGTRQEALGNVWIAPHAPALTQGEMVELACQTLGIERKIAVISPFMMRLAGLFVPQARASVEMMYEFTAPFVVDSKKFEQAFQVRATASDEGIRKTVTWYLDQHKSDSGDI